MSGNPHKAQDERILRNIFPGIIGHEPATVKKRGVLIGLSHRLNWQELNSIADPAGQFLILQGLIKGIKWTLIVPYVPHSNKLEFFVQLIKTINNFFIGNMIIMGDFNAVMDTRLDKSNMGSTHSVIPQVFINWLVDKGFIDTWQSKHMKTWDYTFFLVLIVVFQ